MFRIVLIIFSAERSSVNDLESAGLESGSLESESVEFGGLQSSD